MRAMAHTIRWILILPAAVASWYAALFLGLAMYRGLESFCPEDQMVSGHCFAPWFSAATDVLFAFGAALAAVLVMVSCTWVAPTHKRPVAIATFAVGAMVAMFLGRGSSQGMASMVAAILAGAVTLAILLRKGGMAARVTSLCIIWGFAATAASADPLAGKWVLNVARSHYGGGAEVRKEETLTCQAEREIVKCTIESVRSDGRKLVGSFSAAYDGKPYPAKGIPDVDQVALQRSGESIADATFSFKGKPVFGYRAIRSDNGRCLTFVSVDPTTRVVRNSIVVYERK